MSKDPFSKIQSHSQVPVVKFSVLSFGGHNATHNTPPHTLLFLLSLRCPVVSVPERWARTKSERLPTMTPVLSDSLRPPGLQPTDSSIHGIFKARVLKWVAIAFSGNKSWVLCKWLPKPFTCIGITSIMDSLVFTKIWPLSEGFATFITLVGFLPSVDSLMRNEADDSSEGIPTPIAFIGPLSSVHFLMFLEDWSLSESLPTLITFIGSLSSVNSLVFYKACPLNTGFSTYITFVGFLSIVDSLMLLWRPLWLKDFPHSLHW